jgi:hypothetical protein
MAKVLSLLLLLLLLLSRWLVYNEQRVAVVCVVARRTHSVGDNLEADDLVSSPRVEGESFVFGAPPSFVAKAANK